MSCREIQIFTGASQLKWAPEQEPKGESFEPCFKEFAGAFDQPPEHKG